MQNHEVHIRVLVTVRCGSFSGALFISSSTSYGISERRIGLTNRERVGRMVDQIFLRVQTEI